MRRQTATIPFVLGGTIAILEQVPAEVCESCREPFLDADATDVVVPLLTEFCTEDDFATGQEPAIARVGVVDWLTSCPLKGYFVPIRSESTNPVATPKGKPAVDESQMTRLQRELCSRYAVAFVAANPQQKVGIARNVREGLLPINGLRHAPTDDTTGWYIWAGEEPSDARDFFVPLHVEHVADWCPTVLRFLGLPPGWRFLFAGDHEDVWEDPSLLDVSSRD